MNIGGTRFTCAQVNQVDMVDYLSSLGHQPCKIKNADYWYLSPFRHEHTASFKVNRIGNVWYDHGIGKGGNMVDFGLLYHQCPVSELLEKFTSGFSFQQQPLRFIAFQKEQIQPIIKIVSESKLHSLHLLRYIRQRRIAENIADKYCREIGFELNNKVFTAIGFRNNDGGFEIRNHWFKGSSSPKTITSIENGAKNLAVFEGFFNFLSYHTIHQNQSQIASDFLILNSTSFFEKSLPFMMQYANTRLYLDRDKTGQNFTQQAIKSSPIFSDESKLYSGYNDLNQWAQEIGKSQIKGLKI